MRSLFSITAVAIALAIAVIFAVGLTPKEDVNSFEKNKTCNGIQDVISHYACLVDHSIKGMQPAVGATDDELTALTAIETMNLVQNIASTSRYSYLQIRDKHFKKPAMEEQKLCLTNAFGICGNHQHLFITILKELGVHARPVDFYYTDKYGRASHATAEVQIGSQWAYFDITWGSFWIKDSKHSLTLLSLDEILQHKGIQITGTNGLYLARKKYFATRNLPDIFSYLTAKDLQILKDKGGELLISFESDGKVNFASRPSYIGANGFPKPISMKFSKQTPTTEAVIDIAGIDGTCTDSNLKIGSALYPIKTGKTKIKIAPNAVMSIVGNDSICYAVINDLKIR